MAWPTPPAAGPGIDFGNGYQGSMPAVGLGSLMQGFTQGLQTGNEMLMRQKQMQNEAGYRNAMLGLSASREGDVSDYHKGLLDLKQQIADSKGSFAPAGQPIQDQGKLVGYTDGHGGLKMLKDAAAGAGKSALTEDKIIEAINQAQQQYSGIAPAKEGDLTAMPGALWNKVSGAVDDNSKTASYNRTALNLASMLPRELSGRSNWNEIEAHIKNVPHGSTNQANADAYFEKLKQLVRPGGGKHDAMLDKYGAP